ncbi:hypothetical protein RSAG8_07585, partial [Rhizoctonia solani AG-8 WAC10335]
MLHTADANKSITSPTVRHWEKASTSLATALSMYLDLCTLLGANSLKEGMQPKALAMRIDSALDSLHTILDQQLGQARSTLSKTRNTILSPATRLPEKVIAKIFTYVVFSDQGSDRGSVATMEESVIAVYRPLHNLLEVCSVWRNATLARGEFWSIVPVLEYPFPAPKLKNAIDLSLERAGPRELHLAGMLLPNRTVYVEILGKHASRFRTVNIISESQKAIRSMMDILIGSGTPTQLSELSIYQKQISFYSREPVEPDHIYPIYPESLDPNIDTFHDLLHSLSILRVRGTQIHLHMMRSSNLTKLRLQEFNFGYDHIMIIGLKNLLSSTTRLRELELVSVRTLINSGWSLDYTASNWAITVPSLQTLLIQDLYYNTLTYLLASITSRSHNLTLYLTENYYQYPDVEHEKSGSPDLATLDRILKCTPIHTLCIDNTPWLASSQLRDLLKSMPMLETLRLDGRQLLDENWNAIQRPGFQESYYSFPHLINLHLSRVRLDDEEALKKMVASYSGSMKRMVLGAAVLNEANNWAWTSLRGDEEIVTWLREKVPDFQLMDYAYQPPEFQPDQWPLWWSD